MFSPSEAVKAPEDVKIETELMMKRTRQLIEWTKTKMRMIGNARRPFE